MQASYAQSISTYKTTLTAGFAAAVQPISAETIVTDENGLHTGEISIPTSDGELPGYFARPNQGTLFPVVLVIHEIFGVHEHIKDLCRRLAKLGYLAVAPELFARFGDVSGITDFQEIISKVVSKVSDTQVLSDLDSTVNYAIGNLDGDQERIAITGFCWGGRITWLYAAHSDNVKAGAAYYGRIVGQNSEIQPEYPIDVASKLKAPVLGLYGAEDQGISLESVEAMRAALQEASSPSKIIVFQDAGHAFLADYRPSYKPEPAKIAWNEMLSWFAAYGVGV